MKKLVLFLAFVLISQAKIPYFVAQSLASTFYERFNFYKIHSNSFFARSGALRENVLNNGVWINERFGFLTNRELDYAGEAKNFYNNFSFGVDTYVPEVYLYMGGAIEIANNHTRSESFSANNGSYALGGYITYFHPSRFYVDLNLKYFYASQNTVFKQGSLSDFAYSNGSNNFYVGLHLGQRFYTSFSPFLPNFFFLEPFVTFESGYLPKQKFKEVNTLSGVMESNTPFGIKANLAFGKEWNEKFKGSLSGGVSLEYDHAINGNISIQQQGVAEVIRLKKRSDFNVGFFLNADFILNSNFRFFFHSKSTFLGKISNPYSMNIGMRFGFGKITQHKLHTKDNIDWNAERLQ